MRKKGLLMEAVKLNNDMAKSSPSAAGFFYRRIGGTLFKVRVYTGSGYADTLDKKIPRLILNEMVTGVSDGKLMETQTANYFSDIYPIDCAVLSANA